VQNSHYQQSLAIFKRLADQDKSNSGWQRDLSVSYERVGDVLVAQGKLQEALDDYQQCLVISNAWQSKTNPTQAGSEISLCRSIKSARLGPRLKVVITSSRPKGCFEPV
jgi:tetratricopeptide (TPR) repeat protein